MVEERELPAPQQPVLWDGQAAGKFPRAVILGDPGSGKTWLLIYEARRLARTAALGLRTQTVDPDDVVLPVFAELSHLGGTGRSLADKLADLAAGGYSYRFKRFLRERVTRTQRGSVSLTGLQGTTGIDAEKWCDVGSGATG
jgi:hypothetical protein